MELEVSPAKKFWMAFRAFVLFECLSLAGLASSSALSGPVFSSRTISLHGKGFELHLAKPNSAVRPEVLVLYASGDGGWFGAAVEMFKDVAELGYPVVGFSTRSYMKLLGYGESPVTVEELAKDYTDFIQQAREFLSLPSATRTILTGWSRGAAFAVLVGSEKDLQPNLAGVVAIGLPDKEELKIRRHGKKIYLTEYRKSRQHLLFDTFQRIPEIAPLPCALIQSSRDDFLPAPAARTLFGADSALKRFFAVEAKNHRFSGGWTSFLTSLQGSLEWIGNPNSQWEGTKPVDQCLPK